MLFFSSYPIIVVPFTLNPVPSRANPFGSILLATYFPILRVFALKTQSSLAPTISVGNILANLYLSLVLANFNFSTILSALLGFLLRGLRVALLVSIT